MSHISRMRGTALAALVMIGGIGGAYAQTVADSASNAAAPLGAASAPAVVAPVAEAAPLVPAAGDQTAMPAAPADTKEAEGNVAELQSMIHGNELTELRTAYNGTYGASLLLYGKEMTYYVVLFQQKNFWRVIKTQDQGRAEAVYADFVHKSAQLADIELRRAKLAAQKAYTERLIALTQEHADRLQADLNVARQQQAAVAARQKQARDEAAALATQKQAAQDQLRELQRQVHQLQRETEQGLPRRHTH
ncbi:DUF2968 domain-containing protein [Trinickia fusca]|uniref:DUF2968 domain-containing protein n=1 Tax=Trinickia fusca TaxID=2419777 RepID=A0A494XW15_9BURK|nr:DUF2968 domain-containing protein [Trinickia fusca]RKP52284.1 DUF2968 domain-containing protein [Trinickia fusca]